MSNAIKFRVGNKRKNYKSIKQMAIDTNVPYMTLYMRLRFGNTPKEAIKKPIRKYTKRVEEVS